MPDEVVAEGQEVKSEGEAEQKPEQQPSDAGDTGEGRSIPYYRFKQVNDKLKALEATVAAYQKFGKPEDLAAMKARLDELQKTSRYTPSEKQQIREELMEAFPELRQFSEFLKSRTDNYTAEGGRRAAAFMKEVGLEANRVNQTIIENAMAAAIEANEDLLRRFVAHDPSVYDDAWKIVKSTMLAKRTVPGAKVEGLKRPPAGGPPKPPAPKKVEPLNDRDVLDDAHEQAFSIIESKMEG